MNKIFKTTSISKTHLQIVIILRRIFILVFLEKDEDDNVKHIFVLL